ncbi:hypothetical protein OG203_02305 [Nocardia sp. NBC_01499]|uniref:hypothetical protein n=1 Tax=Nocardia sp. NBC_01499 TaxID=2903597 RepID=UPI00386DA17D
MSGERPADQTQRRSPRILATLAAILFSTAILGAVLPVAIWPGEAKLTAPLFCEAPYTEPIIVSDTFHDSEGQSTNYSMYCVGDRGQHTEVGFLRPWLALWALHTAHVIVLVILVRTWRWMATRRTDAPLRIQGNPPLNRHSDVSGEGSCTDNERQGSRPQP